MKYVTLLLLSLSLLTSKNELTNEHLKVFEGEWTGKLTYLNYGDDKTLVDLPVRMVAIMKGRKLNTESFYDEGNGRTEKRSGNFRIKGEQVYYNGKWKVESSEIKDIANWNLVLVSEGKDNNRSALFRQTVEVSPALIQVEKWVKYEGESDYFMRNRHVYEKE